MFVPQKLSKISTYTIQLLIQNLNEMVTDHVTDLLTEHVVQC